LANLNRISLLQVAAFQALASLVVEPSPAGDLVPRFELVPSAPPTVPYSTDTYEPYQAAAGPVAVDEGDYNEPLTRAVPVVLAAPEHGAARSVVELTESLWALDAASPAVPRLEALVSQLIADAVDTHVPAYTAHHTTPPPAAAATSILDALVRPTPPSALPTRTMEPRDALRTLWEGSPLFSNAAERLRRLLQLMDPPEADAPERELLLVLSFGLKALRERTKAAVIEAGGMDSLLGFVGVDMAGALRYLLQSSATHPRARGARAYATQLSLLALGAPEVVHDVSQALVGAVVAALAEQSLAALRVRSARSSHTDSAEQLPRQVSDEVERERFLQVH
jgi:hypothetical protein